MSFENSKGADFGAAGVIEQQSGSKSRWIGWLLAGASWCVLLAVCGQWILVRWLGDVWWVGTVALFAPRWPLALPMVVVAVLCLVWRRKSLWVVGASALLLAGPVLGLCVPLSVGGVAADEYHLKVMTVNCGGGANWDSVRRDVEREQPDVVAFQEFGRKRVAEPLGPNWHLTTGHGTEIASRFPILDVEKLSADGIDRWGTIAICVRLQLPVGEARICCLHLNTPRYGLDELELTRDGIFGIDKLRTNTESRSVQSRSVRNWIGKSDIPTIVAGDFNTPVESAFYRRDWCDLQNAFSTVGWGYGHTKVTRLWGVRIDHVLADGRWRVGSCHVADSTGGDHRPVVAELALKKS